MSAPHVAVPPSRCAACGVVRSPGWDVAWPSSLIADNEIELAASAHCSGQTVAQVAQGTKGTEESSRAKVFISEATAGIVDRAVQLAAPGPGHRGVGHRRHLRRHAAPPHLRRPSEAHRAAIAAGAGPDPAAVRVRRAGLVSDRASAEGCQGMTQDGAGQAAPSALVTGASRGIGRAIAERLAAAGLRSRLSGRHAGPLEDLASALEGVARR